MKNIISTFIGWLEAGLAKLKADIEAVGEALWPAIEAAFTAAEQQAISDMAADAENIVSQLQTGGVSGKSLFLQALSELETTLLAAGKTFVLTLATQAVTLAVDKLAGNTGTGNGGNMPSGESSGT